MPQGDHSRPRYHDGSAGVQHMINFFWRWIPHQHNRRALFSGGDKGADRCLRCGKIWFWIIDTNIGITFSFEGWGKAIKEKNRWWKMKRPCLVCEKCAVCSSSTVSYSCCIDCTATVCGCAHGTQCDVEGVGT